MKILIIGGTGLISTAITRQLVARGDEVTLYNRGQRQDLGFQYTIPFAKGVRRVLAT